MTTESSCDSTINGSISDFKNNKDDESIYSTSSSLTSTSSKLSKIVKSLISRNHYDLSSHNEPKSKRSTIHFSLFSRKHQDQPVIPSSSTKSLLVKSKRRNSVINLASRFLQNSSNTASLPSLDLKPFVHYESSSSSTEVGSLLFGKQIQDLDFSEHSKSNNSTLPQRAKSPMLKQLATKQHSLPESDYDSMPNHETKLTTLYTRILSDCDRLLVLDSTAIQEPLLGILSDTYSMIEMIQWDTHLVKNQVIENAKTLEHRLLQTDLALNDRIYFVKQILNQCICQYYKSAMVIPTKGYTIEGPNTCGHDISQRHNTIDYTSCAIDHRDNDAHWFRTYFLNSENVYTFFGYTALDNEPVLISVKDEGDDHLRLIIRTKGGQDQRKIVLEDTTLYDMGWKTRIESATSIVFDRLVRVYQEDLVSNGLQDEILKLDETYLHSKYKFGVLLIKEGQTNEEEWFSNEHDSPSFERFLNVIGRKVELRGYDGWAAGLDTKGGDSGDYLYTNVWGENQLAYHVSTLIPSKQGDKQQIQRKRHIGNDIVCIVFVEGNQPFNPAAIKSQFLHVFIIVRQEQSAWRVEVVTVEDVPYFGPPLPEIFYDEKELESYLLAKLVNAEYAAFKSPKFAIPMKRARESIFTNLVDKGYSLISNEIPLRNKSPSNISIIPRASRSANMIRELSGNIVGLARRKSALELSEKVANYKRDGPRKFNPKKSHSEHDLLNMTSQMAVKKGLKSRIMTSFSGLNQQDVPVSRRRASITSQ